MIESCVRDMTYLQELFLLYCDVEIAKELDKYAKGQQSSTNNETGLTHYKERQGNRTVDHFGMKFGNGTYEEELAKWELLAKYNK